MKVVENREMRSEPARGRFRLLRTESGFGPRRLQEKVSHGRRRRNDQTKPRSEGSDPNLKGSSVLHRVRFGRAVSVLKSPSVLCSSVIGKLWSY